MYDGIDDALMNIGVQLANELAPRHGVIEGNINVRPSEFEEAKKQVDTILDINRGNGKVVLEKAKAARKTKQLLIRMETEADCDSDESERKIKRLKMAVHEAKKTFVQHFQLPEWILDEEKLRCADRAVTTTDEAETRQPLFDDDIFRAQVKEARTEMKESRRNAEERCSIIQTLESKRRFIQREIQKLKALNLSLVKERDDAKEAAERSYVKAIGAEKNTKDAESACQAAKAEEVSSLKRQLEESRKECEQLKFRRFNISSDILSYEVLDGVSIRRLLTAAELLQSEKWTTVDLRELGAAPPPPPTK